MLLQAAQFLVLGHVNRVIPTSRREPVQGRDREPGAIALERAQFLAASGIADLYRLGCPRDKPAAIRSESNAMEGILLERAWLLAARHIPKLDRVVSTSRRESAAIGT